MMKSLYSGVSGLKNHTVRMDVIGNNIANVNTTAYKANSVTFRDVFYQTRTFASSGTNISGGTNPRQVGYGLALGSIDKVMTQSGFTFTGSEYDCAIKGEGFFQVMDAAGNIFYTRNGVFNVDNAGNLVDSNGYIVLGVSGDPTGIGPSSQRINLFIPDIWNQQAFAIREIAIGDREYEVMFEASGYGPNGNIAINITHNESPFATMNGNVLSVQMDLTQEFASPAEFRDAVNAAIAAGGVNPGEGVLPINITFNNVPADTSAISASNTFNFGTAGTPPVARLMQFETVVPGEAGNRFEIAMRTSDAAGATVTARWSQNVLTITLPSGDGAPDVTLAMIQDAINEAAGMERAMAGTPPAPTGPWVEGSGNQARALIVSVPGAPAGPGGIGYDIVEAVGSGAPRRIGLSGGEDNFYRTIVTRMSTVVMGGTPETQGRYAGPQSVRDLETIFIDPEGVIFGEHAVHGRLLLGRIDLAIFQNANGLLEFGTSYYRESLSSGAAEVKVAGTDGAGEIVSGALEMANVDLSQEFSDMIITQRGFQANSRIITVSDTMLEELINLKR
ncbi:MAG: flagellar hook-basal body complex protein [Oscillospiraceae bacterium]|nr:flagellar hook-basal body complex protein [Oscillospiraceae bacterium]